MSKQLTIKEFIKKYNTPSNEQLEVLNLEKKYMHDIVSVLKSKSLQKSLRVTEKKIQQEIKECKYETWDKNILDVMMERLIYFHFIPHWEKNKKIKEIYPSPISSDFAIELDDATICIDAKTQCYVSNKGDFDTLNYSQNQGSFDQKDLGSIEIPHYLSKKNNEKPVLSFIITCRYNQNKKGEHDGFRLYPGTSGKDSNINYEVLSCACLPNGLNSKFFDNHIFKNTKDYKPFTESECEKRGILPDRLVVDKAEYKNIKLNGLFLNKEEFITKLKKSKFKTEWLIDGEIIKLSKQDFTKHSKYKYAFFDKNKKITYRFVKKKDDGIIIQPTKSIGNRRVDFDTLKDRYDGYDNPWKGYQKIKLKELNELN